MDTRATKRLLLPATLAITTFISASSCKNFEEYCVDIETEAKCKDGCGWNEATGTCHNTCHEIPDQADCEALERCEWSEGLDETDTGETGGGESCHEPFT
ncbi:hypothetical protein [Enhygromyxa salina]|uniref:Uncharacterized protein n=1 Tax=Enhygromyxa salina TaxID=215803 RepID=A0A2S9YVH2_9BACT|nr:hypothetical protein [Enhygromyxa salina]PRQ09080.1 hypothetical protein ENSA7_10700 [Enhygromyxa salina]